jgi:hypothetical protein
VMLVWWEKTRGALRPRSTRMYNKQKATLSL